MEHAIRQACLGDTILDSQGRNTSLTQGGLNPMDARTWAATSLWLSCLGRVWGRECSGKMWPMVGRAWRSFRCHYGKSLLGSFALRSHGLSHSRTSLCFPKPAGSWVLPRGFQPCKHPQELWGETAKCPRLGWPHSWGPPAASHPVAEAKHLCPFQPLGNITSQLLVLLVAMKSPFWLLTENTLALWWSAPRDRQLKVSTYTHRFWRWLLKFSSANWLFPRGFPSDYPKHPVDAKNPSQAETPQVPTGTAEQLHFTPRVDGSCCSSLKHLSENSF